MPSAPEPPSRWRVLIARHQAPLDEALVDLVAQHAPGELVVVVRTSAELERFGRLLPFPNRVLTLADFLGAVGPEEIRREDLLPQAAIEHVVEAALPQSYRDMHRRHLAREVVKALRILDANAVLLDRERAQRVSSGADVVAAVVAADEARRERLARWNAEGLWSEEQRVGLASQGTPRLRERFPGARAVVFVGIDSLSPAERAAIERQASVADEVHWLVVASAPGSDDHQALALTAPLLRWLGGRGEIHDLGADGGRAALLGDLFADVIPTRHALPHVHIDQPRTRQEEVDRTVLRVLEHIEQAEVPPHEIAVAVPELGRYAALLAACLTEHGLPYAMSGPGPTRTTAPGNLLSLLLDALAHGLARDDVLDLLGHPLVRVSHTFDDGMRAWVDAPWLRRQLQERGLRPIGRAAWDRCLGRLREPPGVHIDEFGRRRAPPPWSEASERRARTAAFFLDELEALRTTRDGQAFFDRLRALLDLFGFGRGAARAVRLAHDGGPIREGHARVLAILDDVESAFTLPGVSTHAKAVLDALRRTLWRDALPPTGDSTWGVQVLGLRNARGLRFRHLFVLGATQGALPPVPRDVAMHELLSAATGVRLERLDEGLEARRILHGILADTGGTVILSSPREESDAPVARSVLLEEIEDAFALDPAPEPPQVLRTRRAQHRHAALLDATVADVAIHSAARALVVARSLGEAGSPYAGEVGPDILAAAALFPADDGHVALSPSRVDGYATCPMRSLYRYVFDVASADQREDRIDPRDRGSVIHAILNRYAHEVMEHVPSQRIADDADAVARLVRIATDVLEASRLEGLALEAFRIQLLGGLIHASNRYAGHPDGLLARFLAQERHAPSELLAAEVGFDALAVPGLGPVRLRGRIDRVDRYAGDDGMAIRVIDYKSGRLPSDDLTLLGGHFQLPLYVHAARALFPEVPVKQAALYSLARPTKKDTPRRTVLNAHQEPDGFHRLIDVDTPRRINEILDAVRDGHWNLTLLDPELAGCPHCDYRRICGLRPHLQRARQRRAAEEGPYRPDIVGGA